ncbi:hypothetical protein CPB86DRAFT_810037 [Serendipita vermifera]|nr:hypothetical protein CPB86DRAFT_810037 [Serendipita vermifera]
MAHYTQLPERRLTKHSRDSRSYTSSKGDALSTDVLLSQLQTEFDKDEEKMSQNILFYRDVVIEEHQKQENKVRFLPELSKSGLDDEQWKPSSSRTKYPPTPAKPSPSTIARMMDISYTSWSNSSYEDTTADSKLADWLASFAAEGDTGVNVNISTRNPFTVDATGPSYYHTLGSEKLTKSRGLTARTLHVRPRATPWNPHHRRAVSQPSYSTSSWIPSSPASPFLQTTPNRTVRAQLGDAEDHSHSVIQDHSEDEELVIDEEVINAPFTPSLDSDAGSSPLVNYTPVTTTTPPPIPHRKAQVKFSPIQSPSFHGPSFACSTSIDETNGLNVNIPTEDSHTTGLADISGVHVFNRALQHASRSTSLIRAWKKMLGELTGRFPLYLHPRADQSSYIEHVSHHLSGSVDSSIVENPFPVLKRSESLPDLSLNHHKLGFVLDTVDKPPVAIPKTNVDILLDREYNSYLNACIDQKRKEVSALRELIVQRENAVRRLEEVAKRRVLDNKGG